MIIRMRKDHHYTTSRDYETLWILAQATGVICIVDSNGCRDIAASIWDGEAMNIGARGISYIYAWDIDGFMSQCRNLNLEYIVPVEK